MVVTVLFAGQCRNHREEGWELIEKHSTYSGSEPGLKRGREHSMSQRAWVAS